MEPTLFAYTAYAPPNYTFPFGTHIAVVEVDRETGFVKLQKYFGIDDCGKLINPMLVEGQFQGGVAARSRPGAHRGDSLRRERPAAHLHARRLPNTCVGHDAR